MFTSYTLSFAFCKAGLRKWLASNAYDKLAPFTTLRYCNQHSYCCHRKLKEQCSLGNSVLLVTLTNMLLRKLRDCRNVFTTTLSLLYINTCVTLSNSCFDCATCTLHAPSTRPAVALGNVGWVMQTRMLKASAGALNISFTGSCQTIIELSLTGHSVQDPLSTLNGFRMPSAEPHPLVRGQS